MFSARLILFHSAMVTLCGTSVYGAPDTLRFVNLVYRHGDRSPISSYPNNPNPVNTTWPNGFGWLTPEGMKMHYSLGRFLRRRYDGFLSQRYKHTEIRVQSSDVDRCLLSAYSNLAGLYPPSGNQVWNENITWQPIPVHTRPSYEDRLLNMNQPCPMYDQLFEESLESERIRREEQENKDFYDFIEKMTGTAREAVDNIWLLADNFYCEKQHNISWPHWLNMSTYEHLRELEALGYTLKYGGKKSYFKGGPLVKDWIHWTQRKIDDQSYTTRMNMYSAHDSTVVAILSALRLHNDLNPPYTATVFMELHQGTSGDFYIELYFRNKTSQDPNDDTQPYPLTLQGCDFQCPFDKFVTLTKDFYPSDWDAKCSTTEPTTLPPSTTKSKTFPPTDSISTPLAQVAKKNIDFKTGFIASIAVYSVVVVILCGAIMVTCSRLRRGSGKSNPV